MIHSDMLLLSGARKPLLRRRHCAQLRYSSGKCMMANHCIYNPNRIYVRYHTPRDNIPIVLRTPLCATSADTLVLCVAASNLTRRIAIPWAGCS